MPEPLHPAKGFNQLICDDERGSVVSDKEDQSTSVPSIVRTSILTSTDVIWSYHPYLLKELCPPTLRRALKHAKLPECCRRVWSTAMADVIQAYRIVTPKWMLANVSGENGRSEENPMKMGLGVVGAAGLEPDKKRRKG